MRHACASENGYLQTHCALWLLFHTLAAHAAEVRVRVRVRGRVRLRVSGRGRGRGRGTGTGTGRVYGVEVPLGLHGGEHLHG